MSGQKICQAEGLLMRAHDPTSGPPLPVKGQKNILITAALPYVNNVPHLGNIIGSSLSADVFARYCRTRNLPTLFVCGNDEYGTAVETKAVDEGVPPLEITSHFHHLHAQVYKWFEIGFDVWGRTATPKHTEFTQQMYKNIHDRGYVRLETSDQPYCEEDGVLLADRFIEGTCPQCGNKDARGDQCDKCLLTFASPTSLLNPRCKRNKDHTVSVRAATHACLRLDKLQPELEEWIRVAQAKGQWASNSTISAEGYFVEPRMSGEGLTASAVTRDVKWGVELPEVGNEEEDKALEGKVFCQLQTTLTWLSKLTQYSRLGFDALNGYHSITASQNDRWEEWWMKPDDVELYQFMGKDNVFYHTVLFPAMLLADGRRWTMPHKVCHTNYLYYESQKFSKSRNIGVFGNNAEETGVPASVWRYYLLSIRPEVIDSAFTWNGFIGANNEDLVANLGQFVYRTISFINVNYNSVVPDPSGFGESSSDFRSLYEKLDADFIHDTNHLLSGFRQVMDDTHLKRGLAITMGISARGNQYLRAARLDNALVAKDPRRCAEIVLNAVNLVYLLSVVLHSFMPSVSDSILEQLNAPARTLPEVFAIDILPGHRVGTARQLFKEIGNVDGAQETAWRKQFDKEPVGDHPGSGASAPGETSGETPASI